MTHPPPLRSTRSGPSTPTRRRGSRRRLTAEWCATASIPLHNLLIADPLVYNQPILWRAASRNSFPCCPPTTAIPPAPTTRLRHQSCISRLASHPTSYLTPRHQVRDSGGKEIRYPVLLTATEKEMARRISLAFEQVTPSAPEETYPLRAYLTPFEGSCIHHPPAILRRISLAFEQVTPPATPPSGAPSAPPELKLAFTPPSTPPSSYPEIRVRTGPLRLQSTTFRPHLTPSTPPVHTTPAAHTACIQS